MTARTHDLFALACITTLAMYAPPSDLTIATLGVSLLGNTIGALVPDIDQATNNLWKILPAGHFLAVSARRIFYKHRTITHSLLGGFLLYKLLQIVLPTIFNPISVDAHIILVSMMVGFASHLFADSLTKEGVPLFFPLPIKIGFPPISALRISTDKLVENVVIIPGLFIYLFWLVTHHQDKLSYLLHLAL